MEKTSVMRLTSASAQAFRNIDHSLHVLANDPGTTVEDKLEVLEVFGLVLKLLAVYVKKLHLEDEGAVPEGNCNNCNNPGPRDVKRNIPLQPCPIKNDTRSEG